MSYQTTTFSDGAVITTSDTADNYFSAIYVGGTGNVTVVTEAGNSILISAVPVGVVLPIRVKQVKATGTTATLLVGLR
jgi:hypothetical protein